MVKFTFIQWVLCVIVWPISSIIGTYTYIKTGSTLKSAIVVYNSVYKYICTPEQSKQLAGILRDVNNVT